MKLNDLISKYLDSELTPSEDYELRALLAEDTAAKQEFDTAVYLHLAMKEDAKSIRPPEELVRDTQDKVLMKILSRQPIVFEMPAKPKARPYKALITLAAALLIFGVFQIADFNRINDGSEIANLMYREKQNLLALDVEARREISSLLSADNSRFDVGQSSEDNAELSSATSFVQIPQSQAIAEQSSAVSDIILSDNELTTIDEVTENHTLLEETTLNEIAELVFEIEENLAVEETLFNETQKVKEPVFLSLSKSDLSSFIVSANDELLSNESNKLGFGPSQIAKSPFIEQNILDFSNDNFPIRLSSFMGTSVSGASENNNQHLITMFSQGIGYGLNESQSIGIEFGYTEFKYDENVKMKVPMRFSGGSMVQVSDIPDQLIDPEIGGNNPSFIGDKTTYIDHNVSFDRRTQLFWGTAFYEQNIVSLSDFYLRGRVAAGASSEGALSYGRLYANYAVFSGFSLTLGAEGRLFYAQYPKLSGGDKSLKSAAFLVYGFQFRF